MSYIVTLTITEVNGTKYNEQKVEIASMVDAKLDQTTLAAMLRGMADRVGGSNLSIPNPMRTFQ